MFQSFNQIFDVQVFQSYFHFLFCNYLLYNACVCIYYYYYKYLLHWRNIPEFELFFILKIQIYEHKKSKDSQCWNTGWLILCTKSILLPTSCRINSITSWLIKYIYCVPMTLNYILHINERIFFHSLFFFFK